MGKLKRNVLTVDSTQAKVNALNFQFTIDLLEMLATSES